MNVSNISSTLQAARPVAVEVSSPEARSTRNALASDTQALTEQSVEQAQKAEATRDQLQEAVQRVNDFVQPFNNGLQFSLDDDTGKTIVKVIDKATDEVIRQFPSEEMLNIAKALDTMKGLLIQQKA